MPNETDGASLDERVRELLESGAHDRAATEAIRALGPRVLRYVRTIVADEDDAKDAFALWSEGVWKGLPRFRGEASLRTWTLRLAHDSAVTVVDHAWRRRARPFVSGEASRISGTIHTASAVRLDRRRRKLDELAAGLAPEDRALLSLRIDQRLSWEEIATVISTGSKRLDPRTVAKRYEGIGKLNPSSTLREVAPRHPLRAAVVVSASSAYET